MRNLNQVELIRSHDDVAANSTAFGQACSIAAFLWCHSHPSLSCPLTYSSLSNALTRLPENSRTSWTHMVKLVYLSEQGLLPDHLSSNADQADERKRRQLLSAAISFAVGGRRDDPVGEPYKGKFADWIDALCRYHDIHAGQHVK